MSDRRSLITQALSEVSRVFDRDLFESAGQDAVKVLVDEIASSKNGRIVVYGVGREGLIMRALAMRLYHLGLQAHVVGDMSTPPVTQRDLVLVSAGPGGFSTVDAILRTSKSAGARTVAITAQPDGTSASLADRIAYLPAQTMADDVAHPQQLGGDVSTVVTCRPSPDLCALPSSVLPMGSVYEGAMFFLFEVVVYLLRDELGESAESMRSRHTNLE